jgi:hypothetical protein
MKLIVYYKKLKIVNYKTKTSKLLSDVWVLKIGFYENNGKLELV